MGLVARLNSFDLTVEPPCNVREGAGKRPYSQRINNIKIIIENLWRRVVHRILEPPLHVSQ